MAAPTPPQQADLFGPPPPAKRPAHKQKSQAPRAGPQTLAGQTFTADLVRVDGKKPVIADEATALGIAGELQAARPRVTDVTRRESSRNPAEGRPNQARLQAVPWKRRFN